MKQNLVPTLSLQTISDEKFVHSNNISQKYFKFMRKQYVLTLPKATDIKKQAYNSCLANVNQLFDQIKQNYAHQTCQHLCDQLKRLKDIQPIKKNHKKPIYEFFLQRELDSLGSIKNQYPLDFDIMRLTKCKIDDFKVCWRTLWERIKREVPQTSSAGGRSIENFFKHLQPFYDENNALDVWKYFQYHDFKSIIRMVSSFVRITQYTKEQVFIGFINLLIEKCKTQRISKQQFISLFVKYYKFRKQLYLPQEIFEYVNSIVLQFILSNSDQNKKGSFQNNFNAFSAQLVEKVIGKSNPGSIQILKTVFSFVKKFVKPLENSSKSVMFVYWFLKTLFLRVDTERRTREKYTKLIEKIQGKKLQQSKTQNEETGVEKNNDQFQQQEEQQQEQNDEPEEQQDHTVFLQLKIEFEKDEEDEEKGDTDQQKKERMEKLLSNQINQEILKFISDEIDEIFEMIYYVNSKKTIPHLLRYIYRLFPRFVVRSFEVLARASTIPNINEDGLIKNLLVTVEHMFMNENYVDGVQNVMKVLDKAFNSRRVFDVWKIYYTIYSKIPILDEKDAENIPEADKEQFEKKFDMNHDRFYIEYSDHIVEAFKRLLRQGEYLEKKDHKSLSSTLQQIYVSSYPFLRKRILSEAMQIAQQNLNPLVLIYLAHCEIPEKQYKILKNQFCSMNEENKDTEDLRHQFLGVLSKNMSLEELKPFIRKSAEKGHFGVVEEYASYKIIQIINWKLEPTTLKYLYEDPKLQLQLTKTIEQRRNCLKQLMKYRDELLTEAGEQIQKVNEDEVSSVSERIIKSYTTPAKIVTLGQRKKIFELLSIVGNINSMMENKLITIKNSKKLELVDSEVSPYGFLNDEKPFFQYIKKLLNSQEVLHDQKLITVLNGLLTNEFYLYFDIEINEDKKINKQKKKNKNHQSHNCINLLIYTSQYIGIARKYMAHLLHRTHGGVNHRISGKTDELFILSMVNSNESYKDIRSMFQDSKMIKQYRAYLINLMSFRIQNRELIKRTSSTLEFILKRDISYYKFEESEMKEYVQYHTVLLQSNDSKSKQNALKSFKSFTLLVKQNPIRDSFTEWISKYKRTEKLELVWLIYTAALLDHRDFLINSKEKVEEIAQNLLKQIGQLLLSGSRSIRRVSLFLYPYLIRLLKKLNTKFQTKSFPSESILQKSLDEFIETGYLRPQFYEIDLKDKARHSKHLENTFETKNNYNLPNLFSFLIDNPQNSNKFLKNFHADLAATPQMLISAIQSYSLTTDLFSIACRAVEKLIVTFKTKQMANSRIQIFIGLKLFKYLFIQDALSGYRFHKIAKDFILSCLSNMESLDNQTLVIIYSYSLFNTYQNSFKQRIPEVEQFLSTILQYIINKTSKLIFSKIQLIFFKKIKNRGALKFVQELCQRLIDEDKKLYRAGYIMAMVTGRSYGSFKDLLAKMFKEKIQLEHETNVNSIIQNVLNISQTSLWDVQQIKKTKIIDLQRLISQEKIIQVNQKYISFSTRSEKNLVINQLKAMLEGDSVELIKTGFTLLNNTLKNAWNLCNYKENCDYIVQLLKLSFRMIIEKSDLQLEFQNINRSISLVFVSKMLDRQVFQKYFSTLLSYLKPNKKSCDLILQVLISPLNYLKLSLELANKFINVILDFESSSALYKQVLNILSTFFRYRIDTFEKALSQEKENKNKRALILQSYLLAENTKIDVKYAREALKISQKDRKNIWARQMLAVRGKKQHFDNEQTHQIWRQIKQISNPYNYIV